MYYNHNIFNVKNLILFIFNLTFLIYSVVVFYKIDFARDFLSICFIYIFVPLLLILFLNIIFFLKYDLYKKAITVFLALSFSLFLLEFLIHFFLKDISKYNYINNQKEILKKEFNFNSYEEQILQELKSGKTIYPSIYSVNGAKPITILNKKYYAFGGVPNSKILFCNDSGKYQIFESDRYGFNNPDIIWEKNIDLVLLGDSYIMGHCIDQEKTISNTLNRSFNTLNLSYSMGGTLNSLGVLSEYALNLEPKLVIYFFYFNDLTDNVNEKKNLVMNKYINNEKQNLLNIQSEINLKIKEIANDKIREIKNGNINKINKNLFFTFNPNISDFNTIIRFTNIRQLFGIPNFKNNAHHYDYALFSKILSKINQKVEFEMNSDFLTIILPTYEMMNNKNSKNIIVKNKLIKIFETLNISFIDFHEIFLKKNLEVGEIFKFNGSHYNEKGYQEISNYLIEYIE